MTTGDAAPSRLPGLQRAILALSAVGGSAEGIALEDGRMPRRIPYFPLPWDPLEAPCGVCGVPPGALHRRGYGREVCPASGTGSGSWLHP